jgi:hypothetical protein
VQHCPIGQRPGLNKGSPVCTQLRPRLNKASPVCTQLVLNDTASNYVNLYTSIHLILLVIFLYRTPPMILWLRHFLLLSFYSHLKFWTMLQRHTYFMYMLMCLKINVCPWNCQHKHCYKYNYHLYMSPPCCFKLIYKKLTYLIHASWYLIQFLYCMVTQ